MLKNQLKWYLDIRENSKKGFTFPLKKTGETAGGDFVALIQNLHRYTNELASKIRKNSCVP